MRVGAEGGMSTHSIQERARDIFLFESRCHGFILQIQDETRSRTEIPLSMDFIIQEKKLNPQDAHRDGTPTATHRRG